MKDELMPLIPRWVSAKLEVGSKSKESSSNYAVLGLVSNQDHMEEMNLLPFDLWLNGFELVRNVDGCLSVSQMYHQSLALRVHNWELEMFEEFKDLRRIWNQINSTPNVQSFVPSETYDSVFRPVPDRTYGLSPIQREETWAKEPIVSSSGKRVNIKKLFRQYEWLEEEGATEETLQAISRAIHMEVNRRVDNGEDPQEEDSEDDEPLENVDNDGDASSTHDSNDHSPIQKEEV
ncbi:uncharacterized protein LOC113279454 [Papaver somniferum]|uniref:uncharacterized protein LOC113279454 n=1 Tax=Papaver somniferum TaxID=3469 RepID=UPI000E6F57AD|nr:uncharacterized protein LOC113279454 [Papaver somniferum]